jgi:hypothetical protein
MATSEFTKRFTQTFQTPERLKKTLETRVEEEREKGLEFRQAPKRTFGQKIKSLLPRSIREGLFGRAEEFISRTGRAPETIKEQLATGGLLRDNIAAPFITRSRAVQAQLLENRLIKDGADSKRAFQIAQTLTASDVTPIEKESQKKDLGLSGSEKKSVRIRELAGGLGAVTDVAGVVPIGGILKMSGKALSSSLKLAHTVDDVTRVLKNAGVADDLIKTVAPKFAKLTDEKAIQAGITSLEKTLKETSKITPLPQEARKVAGEVAQEVPVVTAGTRERGFVTSVKEVIPSSKVAGRYVPRGTDQLAIRARNEVLNNIENAERIARTGTDDTAVATASELIKHYGDLAEKAGAAEKIAFYDKAAEIANEIAPKLTELGQSIQAASILGRMTPEGQLRFAAGTIQKFNEGVDASRGGILGVRKKIPELTGEQSEHILKQMKDIRGMPDGPEKAIKFQKLQREIADLVPTPLFNKLVTLWKAGLLTGIKTTGLNMLSNLFHGISEIVKDVPAMAVDSVASLFTGKRTLAFTTRQREGIEQGFEKGIQYIKTGFDERNVAIKLDYKRVNFGKSKFAKGVQTYVEAVFRWLGAQDQPFYYGANARSMYSQALAQGKNKGLSGNGLKKFADKLVKSPTDEMIKYAANDAEIAVFQNRTVLGEAAKSFQKIGRGAGEIVVPFGRTPAAVATQIINYSPVGVVKTIVQNIGKGRFDQRLFSQGLGRGFIGVGVMYIGTKMFDADLISLDFPRSARERRQWELEGRKSNAFKTPDGKWRSVNVLGPAGIVMLLGGHFQRFMDETGSVSQSLVGASAASIKSFREQTFLTGVNQFSEAINDPERYGTALFSRLFGSIIPTISGDIAKATDPLTRRTSPVGEGFLAPLKAKVPGVRRTLEPRIDAMGSVIARMGNALETMIDPTRPTRIKSDDVIIELRRLFDAGMPATPTKFAEDRKTAKVLTPEQRTYLMEKAGTILEEKLTNLIAHPDYAKLSDEEKMKKIKEFTTKSRDIARAEMVQELLNDVPTGNIREKLSELKQEKFLTGGVFNAWQALFATR